MPTSPTAIVDNILDDLTNNAGIPTPTKTHKYSEPTVIMGGDCPLLAVWAQDTEYTPIDTSAGAGQYARTHSVGVAWYILDVTAAETGGYNDPADAANLNTIRELIVTRLAAYYAGVPGFGHALIGTVRRSSTRPLEGSIWRARIELDVEEDA